MFNIVDGQLSGPNPQHAYDKATANESLKNFAQFDIETVICYHGGVFKDNVNQRIAELAKEETKCSH